MNKRENDAIKVLIERYKRRAANYSDEVRQIDHEVMTADLIEFLDDSAKIEQIDV